MERIDKVLINTQCNNLFQSISLEHLNRTTSDHSPMVINFKSEMDSNKRRFLFQNFWLENSHFKEEVAKSWKDHLKGNAMYFLSQNLKSLKIRLIEWNKCTYGNIFQKVIYAEDIVQKMVYFEIDKSMEHKILLNKAEALLKKRLKIEESFWNQKDNLKWAQDGDVNTKFFPQLGQIEKE